MFNGKHGGLMKDNNEKRGFSSKEAAEYLGIAESTLRQGRMDGRRENRILPPPYIKCGKKIIYLRDDLDLWLEAHRRGGGK